jgi:glycosyltransferase involved in cell wall biosynthesis
MPQAPGAKDEGPETTHPGSSRSWHILTGEYPPQPGGVADYTGRLAAGLAARGEEVHVWRPGESETTDGLLRVRALPHGFSARGLRAIGRGVDESRASGRTPILLVQYAPNAFGMRGANVMLCAWLLLRGSRQQDDVRVMFHEPFLYFARQSVARNALALVHRLMAALLIAASRVAYVSTGSWEALLSRYAARRRTFIWLPIPATVPPPDDPDATARARAKAAPDGDTAFVVGHFSSYPEDVASELTRVAAAVLDAAGNARLFLIGRHGDRFARAFGAAHPRHASRVVATGELRPGEVAAHLRACDVLVQPYPDGATTRRTSLMAPLSCGVPTVTTLGRWSEPVWRRAQDEAAVELAPAGDVAAIVGRCQALATDGARRRALSGRARAFYERHFTLERTLRILCGAARGQPSVLIGVHAHPATGETERRQRAALAALAALDGVRRVNLQFASAACPVIDADGFETMRMMQTDSTSVTGHAGIRKPIASEVFDLLARRALEEGSRYFVYVNADTALAQSAVDRIAAGDADAYVLARTDVGGGRPPDVLLSGSDGFAVSPLWWVSNGRRFRPYIIGEAVWDNVYAAQLACHGRTTFVYEAGALTHERHDLQWTATPFGRYIQYLSALDAPYFSLWCRFHERLRRACEAGDGSRRAAAVAAETFLWPPPRAVRVVQAVRRVKGWLRHAAQETAA